MQIKAGFKKEFMLFSRTHRLLGLVLVFIGLAVFSPIMVKGTMIFAEWYDNLLYEMGVDIGMSMYNTLLSVYGPNGLSMNQAMVEAVNATYSNTVIVMIILLMLTAGGEQKKRSTIIPSCSGLQPLSYSLPKFVFYPALVFVLTIVSNVLAYLVCLILFPTTGSVSLGCVLLSGVFLGLYLVFITFAHLFIGISTSRPGLSAVILIVVTAFFPTLLSLMGIADKYNPFALGQFSLMIVYYPSIGEFFADFSTANIVVSIIITVILCLILFFLTLLVQNVRKIDNTDNDVIF